MLIFLFLVSRFFSEQIEEQQVKKRTKELDGPKHRTSFIDSKELFLFLHHLKPTNTKTTSQEAQKGQQR